MRQRCIAILCILYPVFSVAAQAAPKPLKVLLITGGCCHDYTPQKQLLKKGLEERAYVEVTVVEQGGRTTDTKIPLYESADWAKGYDLVIHDECFAEVKDPSWTQRVLRPHQNGLPAVVLHCAMHCYRDGTDSWFEFCGVTSHRHGAQYAHEVLNGDAEHPIMQGFGAGWANPAGELYWIEKLWPKAHPLASAKNREQGNEEVCVWTNDYRGARVFGTTLGHHNETVGHPKYLDLVTRGALWACNKLDDQYLKPVGPKLVPVNLAKGAKASASSEETAKNNFARHAVDGNESTRWCANNGSGGQWIQLDLGKPQPIKGCELKWENSSAIYRYTLEGSADGKSWRMIHDGTNNKSGQYTLRFEADDLQHLRLTYLGSNTGSWGSLWEINVFGDKMIEVSPEKASHQAEQARLAEVKVPEGFEATVFAAPPAVNYPVSIAAAPDGVVYVSVDKNGSLDRAPRRGSVIRLRDVDGDGRADESKLFVADVDSPRGLVWDRDRLYLMHPPHLSAFIDTDGDGRADQEQVLVKNIAFGFKDRPADHTSNGVTLGIDGWLYLAIGDFGFLQAEGTDGRKLPFRGGGVVRVRPDGTGLEVYSRGTRNILEVALDPLLDGFVRDNTNDGGGWDIRLHHFSGLEDHGYPRLFKNFGDEIIQPLADYGGGSGCGTLYLSEPGFPAGYGDALYTADWGREWVYRHQLSPNGATFAADQQEFVRLPRVTDLDVDAQSRLYLTSWKGATYTYAGEDVGYLVRVVPKNAQTNPVPDFAKASEAALVGLLRSDSHRRRLAAQRELLHRGLKSESIAAIEKLAADTAAPLACRVAAMYTLKQAQGVKSHATLARLAEDAALRPLAVRALADRWDQHEGVPVELIVRSLGDENPRTRLEAAVAVARLGLSKQADALTRLLSDSDPVVAHTAVQALAQLKASQACFAIVDDRKASPAARTGALRVLQSLHDEQVADGLLARLKAESDSTRRRDLLVALCRLARQEGTWKGDSWGTRPDTRGPYYQPARWSASSRIESALQAALASATGDEAAFLAAQLQRHRIDLSGSLERLIALAGKDPKLIPSLVTQLVRDNRVPPGAVKLLKQVVQSSDRDAALRAQAAGVLLESDAADRFQVAFAALPSLSKALGNKPAFGELWGKLTSPQAIGPQMPFIVKQAAGSDAPAAVWANAALLALDADKNASPENRELARAELAKGWAVPTRRAQILEAVRLTNHRAYEDQVRSALGDPDKSVAAAAAAIARDWKLPASVVATGPKVGTLKPEEAIAATLKQKGDVERGKYLYATLNCAKCHTVSKDEPLRGPYLPAVAKTYKREQLAESILLPSKSLAQGFVTNAFVLDDGKTYTGFVTGEAADEVTIRDNQGNEIRISTASIEARAKQDISVMPEDLAKEISLKDFVSLVDYLQSIAE